jgi:hypothetical protein
MPSAVPWPDVARDLGCVRFSWSKKYLQVSSRMPTLCCSASRRSISGMLDLAALAYQGDL